MEAIEAMREVGLDLKGHRSSALGASDLRQADLVIAMTREHLDELANRFGDTGGTRYLLRAFDAGTEPAAEPPDLDDPIGDPVEVYREQLAVVARCGDNLVAHLEELA